MPEGHAVIRWARALAPIVGQPLTRVAMPKRWGDRPAGLIGQTLREPVTRGKHLLLPLSGGETLHCHGAMYGSWQVGPRPLALKKPEARVRLRLDTAAHEAVFYNGPTAELLTPDQLAAHERLAKLGPDVMAPLPGHVPGGAFDRAGAARRIRQRGAEPLKPTLIDQAVVSGIGNIFSSEGLFVARIDPQRPAESVTDAELDRLWDAVHPMMWAGADGTGRTQTTTPEMQADGKKRWVYQRKGKPCWVCGTPIELVRMPPYDRATYLCPTCQS